MADTITGARLAKVLGVTPAYISQLKKAGNLAPKGSGFDLDGSVQGFIDHLKSGDLNKDLLRARIAKTKTDEKKVAMQNRILSGEMVSVADVKDEAKRAGEAFKAALRRLESDLPPMVEGLDAAGIQKRVQGACDGILRDLSDLGSSLWETAKPTKASGGRRPKRAGK